MLFDITAALIRQRADRRAPFLEKELFLERMREARVCLQTAKQITGQEVKHYELNEFIDGIAFSKHMSIAWLASTKFKDNNNRYISDLLFEDAISEDKECRESAHNQQDTLIPRGAPEAANELVVMLSAAADNPALSEEYKKLLQNAAVFIKEQIGVKR